MSVVRGLSSDRNRRHPPLTQVGLYRQRLPGEVSTAEDFEQALRQTGTEVRAWTTTHKEHFSGGFRDGELVVIAAPLDGGIWSTEHAGPAHVRSIEQMEAWGGWLGHAVLMSTHPGVLGSRVPAQQLGKFIRDQGYPSMVLPYSVPDRAAPDLTRCVVEALVKTGWNLEAAAQAARAAHPHLASLRVYATIDGDIAPITPPLLEPPTIPPPEPRGTWWNFDDALPRPARNLIEQVRTAHGEPEDVTPLGSDLAVYTDLLRATENPPMAEEIVLTRRFQRTLEGPESESQSEAQGETLWTWAIPHALIRVGRTLSAELLDYDTMVIAAESAESLGPVATASLSAVGVPLEPVLENARSGGLAHGHAVVLTPQNRRIVAVLQSDDADVLQARLEKPFGQLSPRVLLVAPLAPSASVMVAALASALPKLWDEPSFSGPIQITALLPDDPSGSSTDPRAAITARLGRPADAVLLQALGNAQRVAGVHQQRREGNGQVSSTSLLIGLNLASEQAAAITERHTPNWRELVLDYTNIRIDRLREVLDEDRAPTPRPWTDNAVQAWTDALHRGDSDEAGALDLLRALLMNPGRVHTRLGWRPKHVLSELQGQPAPPRQQHRSTAPPTVWDGPDIQLELGLALRPDARHTLLILEVAGTDDLGESARLHLDSIGAELREIPTEAADGLRSSGHAHIDLGEGRVLVALLQGVGPFDRDGSNAIYAALDSHDRGWCFLGPSSPNPVPLTGAMEQESGRDAESRTEHLLRIFGAWVNDLRGLRRPVPSITWSLSEASSMPRVTRAIRQLTEQPPVSGEVAAALEAARRVAALHRSRREGLHAVTVEALTLGAALASPAAAQDLRDELGAGWEIMVDATVALSPARLAEEVSRAPHDHDTPWTEEARSAWSAAVPNGLAPEVELATVLEALRPILATMGDTRATFVTRTDTWELAALQLTLGTIDDDVSQFDTLVAEVSDATAGSYEAKRQLAWTGVDVDASAWQAGILGFDEPIAIELDDDAPTLVLVPKSPSRDSELDLSGAWVGANASHIAIHTPRTAATMGPERFFAAIDRSVGSLVRRKGRQSRVTVWLSDPAGELRLLARNRFGASTSREVVTALQLARNLAMLRSKARDTPPTVTEEDVVVGLAGASERVRARVLRAFDPDDWDTWAQERTGVDVRAGINRLLFEATLAESATVSRWTEDLRNSWTLAESRASTADHLTDLHLLQALLRPPGRKTSVLGDSAAVILAERPPASQPTEPMPAPAESPTPTPTPTPTPAAVQDERMPDDGPDPEALSQITLRVGPSGVEIPELSLRRGPPAWSTGFGPSGDAPLSDARERLHTLRTAQTRQLGRQLAVALFGDDRTQVEDALRMPAGRLLRVVLDLEGDAWQLPLEYLATDDRFWFERGCAFVRHQQAQDAVPQSLTLPERPERILMATANPEGRQEFDATTHQAILEDGRKALNTSIVPLSRATPSALRDQLPSVEALHFLGHGGPGHLVLVNDDGSAANTPVEDLTGWLNQLGEAGCTKRFVVLGACDSATEVDAAPSVAREIVKRTGLPTLAMQAKVPQEFSSRFVSAFYANLKNPDGAYEIEQAVYRARQVDDGAAAGIPVLVADTHAVQLAPRYEGGPVHVVLERWSKGRPAQAVAKTDPLPSDAHPSLKEALQSRATDHPSEPLPTEPDALKQRLAELVPEAAHPRGPRVGHAWAVTSITADHDPPLADGWDARGLETLRGTLSFPPTLIPTVVAELRAGRHVLLVGPVGTGKTSLARGIVEALGYTPHVVTASADWTPFEVVGGFWPHAVRDANNGRTHVDFGFRQGAFLDAVMPNWTENEDGSYRRAHAATRGVWLVLDELNRADMDRALGGLFTALETRRLRIPAVSDEPGTPSTMEIPIPQDFRVVATINAADRHYLFRLSDALKRRFAFVDVPVTPDWVDEWTKLSARLDGWLEEQGLFDDLRRFVYLVRQLHPVGSAQLLAAGRFLVASRPDPELPPDLRLDDTQRLAQALRGSVLPTLEELEPRILALLQAWCQAASADLNRPLQDLVLLPGRAERFRAALGGEPDDGVAELARRRHVVASLDLNDVFARLLPDA